MAGARLPGRGRGQGDLLGNTSNDKYSPLSWSNVMNYFWAMFSYAYCCMGLLPALLFASLVGWLVCVEILVG